MANRAVSNDPLVGQRLGHYRIVEKIGRGGMGDVYRAHDDREVAIKVLLPEKLASHTSLGRFHHEAIALSRLTHPNICTIYDVDEHSGRQYIVMELLEGQTLEERIAGRPLRLDELLNLAIQIADALETAHGAGEPENHRLTWFQVQPIEPLNRDHAEGSLGKSLGVVRRARAQQRPNQHVRLLSAVYCELSTDECNTPSTRATSHDPPDCRLSPTILVGLNVR